MTQQAGQVAAGMGGGVGDAFFAGITGISAAPAPAAQASQTQQADPAPAAQTTQTQQQPVVTAPPAQSFQQQTAQAAATETQVQSTTAAPAAQQSATQTTAATQQPAAQEIDLGFGKIALTTQAAPPIPTTYEELFKSDAVKNVLGIQGDLTPEVIHSKVLPAITDMRKNAADAGRMKSELDAFRNTLTGMPPQLAQAVTTYLSKPDSNEWASALNANEITSFTKHVAQIPPVDLVKNMLDIEVTADAIADPSDTNTQKLVAKATELYNEKKAQKDLAIQNQIANAQKLKHDFSAGVSSSAQAVPQYLPVQVDPAQITQATTLLSQGPSGIMSLFFDEKGLPKPDAVANIILVSDGNGKKMVDALTKMVMPQVQSMVNEQIVERGIATQSGGTSAGEQRKLTPQEQDRLRAFQTFGFSS